MNCTVKSRLYGLVLGFGSFLVQPVFAQKCVAAHDLFLEVNKIHLEPQTLNDEFSLRVFREFLFQLDPEQQYLSREDSTVLAVYSLEIDDQLRSGTCRIIATSTEMLRARIQSTQRYVDSTLNRPLNYKVAESIAVMGKEEPLTNRSAQRQLMLKELKFEILSKASRLARAEEGNVDANRLLSFEVPARQSVRKRYWSAADRLLNSEKGLETFVNLAFQRAICQSFDPHTEYFTDGEMEAFEREIRPVELAFGIDLGVNRMGEPIVQRMLPGGPAWRSKELTEGDVLVSMKAGTSSTVDFADLEIQEILSRIDNPDIQQAEFKIRKADGRWKTISLTKEKIENVENLISSFVLEGEVKFGYVALPGFYTSPDEGRGHGCAGDIAKEIIKLKREKIQGLILDLRFNGGGSVMEALELAGIFLDAGPVASMERRGEPPLTLRDDRRGSAYDGPLLIMVNAFSASASELVSAALQDYHRAVVMGCSTYGKATGQTIIPVGAGVNRNGFAKVTIDRINRVTGKSLQLTGVQPDIRLPEITEVMGEREALLRNPIQPRDLTRKIYYTPLPDLPVDDLRKRSMDRVSAANGFKSIEQFQVLLKGSVPLEVQAFVRYIDSVEKQGNMVAERVATTTYAVRHISSTEGLHQVDTYHRDVSNEALKEIQQSHYIREAFFILNDLLPMKK